MRNRSSALLTAAIALLTVACTTRPVQPQLGELTIDTLLGRKPVVCQLTYRFTTITNATKSPALASIEQSNIGYFFELESFAGTAQEALETALRQMGAELTSPDGPLIADNLPTMDAAYISVESHASIIDTLLSYAIFQSSFTGGAHDNYGSSYHTYSLASGEELSLSDLFTPAQTERLNKAIRAKISEQYEAKDDQALSEAGFFPEYIAPTENFEITPSGITFHYNPYDIGCFALGVVEVSFTHEELAQL